MANLADDLKSLYHSYQRQQEVTAAKAIENITAILLDLALETFGPLPVEADGAHCSPADALRYYGQHNEEFAALLFMAGMGEALGLPKPAGHYFDRWNAVRAGRTTRKRSKARKTR